LNFTFVLQKEHPSEARIIINKLSFCFMYSSLIGSFQVSDKTLGHPYTSL
jgi:hypothetical protein